MDKNKITKAFAICFVVALLFTSGTIFAANAIRSASFNDVSVVFNGIELDLDRPMISIVLEESPEFFSNYMPVRAVLEAMGYDVGWDGENNAVLVTRHEPGLHGLTVFWGRTGTRVHISESCRSFSLTPHRGRIEDAAAAERFGWCQICSYDLEERFPIYHLREQN